MMKHMYVLKRVITVFILSFFALTCLLCTPGVKYDSYATSDVIASGTVGTCRWEITTNGIMTIHAGTIRDSGSFDVWSVDEKYTGKESYDPSYDGWSSVKEIRTDGTIIVESAEYLFDGFRDAKKMDLSGLNTSRAISMAGMFSGCSELSSLNITSFDTSNVTTMFGMFEDCGSLKSIDISNFDTRKVTDMSTMFYGCENLTELDLRSFSCNNLNIATWMFKDCSSLKKIKFGKWDESGAEFPVDMVNASTGELYYAEEDIPSGNGLTFVIPSEYSVTTHPSSAKLSLDTYASLTYTGKKITLKKNQLKFQRDGSDIKVSDSEYDIVKKPSMKNVGIYEFELRFKDTTKYPATVSGWAWVNPKTPKISKVKAGKKQFKVTWKKFSKADQKTIDGFYIYYHDKSADADDWKYVKASKKSASKTIKKLQKGHTYQVVICAYKSVKAPDGEKFTVYSNDSKMKNVKIKK